MTTAANNQPTFVIGLGGSPCFEHLDEPLERDSPISLANEFSDFSPVHPWLEP
jgi:hypothetical protein